MPEDERVKRWEVERDRFGVYFSGPLQVGECIEVVPASELDRVREDNARLLALASKAEALAEHASHGLMLPDEEMRIRVLSGLVNEYDARARRAESLAASLAEALEKIASCETFAPGDCSDIARTALARYHGEVPEDG